MISLELFGKDYLFKKFIYVTNHDEINDAIITVWKRKFSMRMVVNIKRKKTVGNMF